MIEKLVYKNKRILYINKTILQNIIVYISEHNNWLIPSEGSVCSVNYFQ